MKKQKITKLRLGEISAVDKPAQPGATALIMKRAGDTPEPAAQATKETEMFKTREELLAAIAKAQGDLSKLTDADRTNIVKSAEALKMTDDVPVSISKAAAPQVQTDPALQATVERLQKAVSLSAEHKAHYDTLTEDAARDAFLAKSAGDRDADIAKAAGPDPVVYTTMSGIEIKKSAGDLAVQLAKQADQTARELAVEKAARVDENLTKRATEELGNLGDDVEVRKTLLRAVDGIADAGMRDKVLAVLKGANTAASGAFQRHGSTGGQADISKSGTGEVALTKRQAEDKLDSLAKDLMKADAKLAYHEAYNRVLDSEEGRKLYAAAA